MYVKQAGELYRLLGDEVRLRLLRVLAGKHGRLNVTELTAVLGIAQSGVSRHLRLLKEAGLVVEERGGGFSFYRLSPALLDGGFAGMWPALQAQFADAAQTAAVRGDEARLQEVIRLRKENFEVHGTDRGQFVPGRSWAAWSRALGLLLPPVEVADIACGEGYLSVESAQWARRVVGIDRSPDVLKRAQGARRTARREEHHVEARRHGKAAARRRSRSTSRCSRRRCTMPRIPRARCRRRRAFCGPAAACWRSICASTIKNGCAIASAIAGSASRTRISSDC